MLYPEVVGHQTVKEILTRSFQSNKIPHSWAFCGEFGCQKEILARSFCQTLLCDDPNDQYCGVCESCRLLENNHHPDLFLLKPTGKMRQIKSNDVQELIRFLSMKSFRGGYKTVIIESAERLTSITGNALLKSLEEPSVKTVFILLAQKASSLLPTVISRCQLIDFLPLEKEVVGDWIDQQEILRNHNRQILINCSKGHLGRLQGDFFDQFLKDREFVIEFIQEWLNEGSIALIHGVERIMDLLQKERKLLEKEVLKELKALKDISTSLKKKKEDELNADIEGLIKKRLDSILSVLSDFLRDIFLFQSQIDSRQLCFSDHMTLIEQSTFHLDQLSQNIHLLDEKRQLIFANVNQKLMLEALFFEIFSFSSTND